ncbi:hypothetical protein [Sinorhizobium meliloti]|uniref:hypothetical protein n=1 Tax=Rhizobium meliloti TaxID=382 RepID=UPI000FE01230|nr:hypothetical protein [Sinorhizobium meliloti]RVO95007.1 hypothetical protein CN089_12540 [Sinorhizobium meliloti]
MTNERISAVAAVVSAILASIALVVSGVALHQSSRQIDIAEEALRSAERNATFNAYVDKVTATCEAMDFSGGANRMAYRFDPTLGIIGFYVDVVVIPKEKNVELFRRSDDRFREIDATLVRVRTWLTPEEFEFIEQASFDLKNTFAREVHKYSYVSVPAEAYLKASALCYGRRDALINWFNTSASVAETRLPDWRDVKLSARLPGR